MADNNDKPQIAQSSDSNEPQGPDAIRISSDPAVRAPPDIGHLFGRSGPAPNRVSRAPAPPPSLDPNGGRTAPPPVDDSPRYPASELREEVERAYEQTMAVSRPIANPVHAAAPVDKAGPVYGHNAGSHGPVKPFTWEDFVVGGFSSFIAIPLCDASWHAIVVEQEAMTRGLIGLAIGLPTGLAGISFHWWKDRAPKFRDWIARQAKWWCPAAVFLVFIYVAGPEMYRRATKPIAVSGAIGAMAIDTNSVHETAKQTTKALAAERDEAVKSAASMAKERDDALHDLADMKRHRDAALTNAKATTTPTQLPVVSGPVDWALDGQLIVASYGGPSALYVVNALIFQGTSKTSFHFKEAYLISGLTGHRADLVVNVQKVGGYYAVTAVDIPAGAPVQLDYNLKPEVSVRDFFDQWGKFRFIVVYDDGSSFEHEFSEQEVRTQAQRQMPNAFGPQVSPKEQK